MTQDEKETIETFCQELASAPRWITGKAIDLNPEILATHHEDKELPGNAQPPPWDQNDLHKQ